MAKEDFKSKIQGLLHPSGKTSDSDSIVSLIKKGPKSPRQTPEGTNASALAVEEEAIPVDHGNFYSILYETD
ncbi:uncharacterized protein BDV14DRAFT_198819 [Aspergillus stella-maris]|uniref:uncharacterized protein n=1 Tax=Aspergillus stella-maris TaxID=1810926 RepID=UPI003CCDCE24